MRVLVTGAGGFIGSHVARHLLAKGDEVTAVLSPNDTTSREADRAPALTEIRADLSSTDLNRLVADAAPEACIHLAWYVEPTRYLTAAGENLASLSTGANILSALEGAGCRRIMLAGTCLEPGTLIDGRSTVARTIYAAAKSALHQVAIQLDSMSAACAHIFYLYGPGERPQRVIPAVIRACLEGLPIDVTSGEQRRDFLYVEDVASAIVSVMKSDLRGGIDVCSGVTTRLRDVFDAIGEATGRAESIAIGGKPTDPDEPLEIAGNTAALNSIGWRPRWSLEEGISDTVQWWRTQLTSGGGP